MRRRWLILMGAVAVAVAGGALAYQYLPDPATGPFAAALPGYLVQIERVRAGTIQPGIANFRGKVVVVDLATRRVDVVQAKLPRAMRASKPEEVGTLIGMVCGTQEVGGYNNGRVETEHRCRAWAIDVVENRPMGQFNFVNPPDEVGSRRIPARPDDQLVDYLKELRMR